MRNKSFADAALDHCGITARKVEKDRKKQVRSIESEGESIPELVISVSDPEKNLSTQDLESLEAPPDLVQA